MWNALKSGKPLFRWCQLNPKPETMGLENYVRRQGHNMFMFLFDDFYL